MLYSAGRAVPVAVGQFPADRPEFVEDLVQHVVGVGSRLPVALAISSCTDAGSGMLRNWSSTPDPPAVLMSTEP